MINLVNQSTAGAGTATTRQETAFKWANTSAQIDRVQFHLPQGGVFAAGGTLKVWGSN